MELTLTHHMIDDVEPQDEAMDQFRKLFRLVAGCKVSKDGRTMTYNLKSPLTASVWKISALKIIAAGSLPLAADIELKEDEGEICAFLVITYKP